MFWCYYEVGSEQVFLIPLQQPTVESSLFRLFSACCAAASVHHTYVGESRRIQPRRVLASVLTTPFFPYHLSAPLLFNRYKIDVVSRVNLPAWPGQGYGRHWLFFRALSPICILSVLGCCIVFKMIWIFVLYICILDSWSCCCIYMFYGSHRGLLCNDITLFSTRTQVPGGHL